MVLSQKKRRKGQRSRLLPVPTRRSQSPSGCAAFLQGRKSRIFKELCVFPRVTRQMSQQDLLIRCLCRFPSCPLSLSTRLCRALLKDALSSTVPVSLKTVNSIDLSGEEDANSHESCETLAVCHSPYGMSPACLSSQNHSCHPARTLASSVVRSVSLSSGSVSCGAALLPAALPVAGVAAAVGSSSGGGRGVASGVGSCVAWGAGVRVAWGGVKGGLSRSRFSLMQTVHARDDPCCTGPGSANSSLDTVNLLPVQQSTSYNLDQVVAHSNSCRKVRQSRTVGIRSVEQTVDMLPAPAAGTYRRSAGTVHAQRQVPWECLAESSRSWSWSFSWCWSWW